MKPPQNPISGKQSQAIALLLLPALTGTIALTLTGCLAEPDGYRYAAPVGGGGNYAPAQPNYVPQPNYAPPTRNSRDLSSQPLTQPLAVQGEGWNSKDETREWHAAASPRACQNIADRFKQYGRKVKLTRTIPTSDKILPFICIFEGEDAEPGYVIPPYMKP